MSKCSCDDGNCENSKGSTEERREGWKMYKDLSFDDFMKLLMRLKELEQEKENAK